MAELSVVVDRLGEIFTNCDRNGDGVVNKRELILACRQHPDVASFWGVSSQIRQEDGSRDALERKFQEIDGNDDRAISWTEFLNFHLQHAQQKAAEDAVVVRSLTDGGHSEASSKGTESAAVVSQPQGTARIMATPHTLTSAGVSSSTSVPGTGGTYVLPGTSPGGQVSYLQPIMSIRSMGQVPSTGTGPAWQTSPAPADVRPLTLAAPRIISQSSVTIASQRSPDEGVLPISVQTFNREPVAGEGMGLPRPPPTASTPMPPNAPAPASAPAVATAALTKKDEDSDSGSDSDSDDDDDAAASPDGGRQGTIKSLARGLRDFMEDVRDGWEELVRYRPEYDRSASSPSQQPSHHHHHHHPHQRPQQHPPNAEAKGDLFKMHDEKYKLEKQQRLLEQQLLQQQNILEQQQQHQQHQYEQHQQHQWEQQQLLMQQHQLQQSLEMHLAAVGHIPQSGGLMSSPYMQPTAPGPMWDAAIPATMPAMPVGSQWATVSPVAAAPTMSTPPASPFAMDTAGFPGGSSGGGAAGAPPPMQTPPVPVPAEPLFEGWASNGGSYPLQISQQGGSPIAAAQQALPPSATMGTCAAFGQPPPAAALVPQQPQMLPPASLGFGPTMAMPPAVSTMSMPAGAIGPGSVPGALATATAPAAAPGPTPAMAMPTTHLQFGGSPTGQHQPWSGDSYVNATEHDAVARVKLDGDKCGFRGSR
eukprot:CAMPEP_0206449320 /NCGR_PEP_ID=MMETSP0324_2-20121206/18019_1 /ASSEMBLY_ACC=CAM_ASM_000836 /TAXON_ID=2866 /ORGANISM="Crypthecodinium cohnii, Strain Seligo" /LENGTH=702 /DNA_ID=CAMNT_0053918675 /DNA_START=45 /DNA_END=2154 /DNA_ORIENTATION=+